MKTKSSLMIALFILVSGSAYAMGGRNPSGGGGRSCIDQEVVHFKTTDTRTSVDDYKQPDSHFFPNDEEIKEALGRCKWKLGEMGVPDTVMLSDSIEGPNPDLKCTITPKVKRIKRDGEDDQIIITITSEGRGTAYYRPLEEEKKKIRVTLEGGRKVHSAVLTAADYQATSQIDNTKRRLNEKVQSQCAAAGGKLQNVTFDNIDLGRSTEVRITAECAGDFYSFGDNDEKRALSAWNAAVAVEKKRLGKNFRDLQVGLLDTPIIFKDPKPEIEIGIFEHYYLPENTDKYKAWECERLAKCTAENKDMSNVKDLASLCKLSQDSALKSIFGDTQTGIHDSAVSGESKKDVAPSSPNGDPQAKDGAPSAGQAK